MIMREMKWRMIRRRMIEDEDDDIEKEELAEVDDEKDRSRDKNRLI